MRRVLPRVWSRKNLAQRLRSARAARRFSLDELSRRSGVSVGALRDLENRGSGNARLSTIRRVARGLGLTVGELVDGEEDG